MAINNGKTSKKIEKSIHSSGKKNLISSTGDPKQKRLYQNPQNSPSGHSLITRTTLVTVFIWSPYFRLQNINLTLIWFGVGDNFTSGWFSLNNL